MSTTVSSDHLEMPPTDGMGEAAGTKLRRRDRPRRPRRITFRVLFFIVLVAAVGVGAWTLVHWYANNSYYVGLDPPNSRSSSAQVVIYRGRPGGVLGLEPKIIAFTGVTLAQVPQAALLVVPNLKDTDGVQEPSLAAALAYVQGLKCQANLVAPASAPVFPGVSCQVSPIVTPTTKATTGSTTTSTAHALGIRGTPSAWVKVAV